MEITYKDAGYAGYVDFVRIHISGQFWEALSTGEKVSLVAHELRHVWQNIGCYGFAFCGLVFPVFALGYIMAEGLSSFWAIVWTIATIFIERWGYVAIRARNSEEWAEMDADRFAFTIAPKGTVSFSKKTGQWVAGDATVYRLAVRYLKKRVGEE